MISADAVSFGQRSPAVLLTQLVTRGVITKPGISSLVLPGQLWSPRGRFSEGCRASHRWVLSDGNPAPQPGVGSSLPLGFFCFPDAPPQWVAPFCISQALKQRKVLVGFHLGKQVLFWVSWAVCVQFEQESWGVVWFNHSFCLFTGKCNGFQCSEGFAFLY